ncbi:MAG: IMP dehydrogenase [Betaproteobacteria bacterium]|nr:IMP dehydrogenase [Betaproteobacteria bacterium]
MAIKVALYHETHYRYDRLINVGPQEVRLKPAVHCRTPIEGYSLRVTPANHFVNWQQDPYGNFVARLVFPERTREMKIVVDLVADMTVINPFDFFLEKYAESFPFAYPDGLRRELAPFLEADAATPLLSAWLEDFRAGVLTREIGTVDMLVELNRRLQEAVRYIVRMEPGVQTPDETLGKAMGSCRDSGWLLVQLLRHLGLAARFVSGYLIQLVADVRPLDGPAGPEADFTDLHAWAEVYLPGAGWVGLDPTSGLMAGEGHIPLAATAQPSSAAPVTGLIDACETVFDVKMAVTRIHEDPRVTKPFTVEQWERVDALGRRVDEQIRAWDVRLTMGGEPTFVAADDMDGVEWNFTALGERKRELAGDLLLRLRDRFSPGSLLYHGQGKWYPGEPLPRWALGFLWRRDGTPLWKEPGLLASDRPGAAGPAQASLFVRTLTALLGIDPGYVIPAYEDVWSTVKAEAQLPVNVDPLERDLASDAKRSSLARLLGGTLGDVRGYVLPLARKEVAEARGGTQRRWRSSHWPLRREHLYLTGGDSPIGYRLPLASLPWKAPEDEEPLVHPDPFAERLPLPEGVAMAHDEAQPLDDGSRDVIKTALCVDPRDGFLNVFLPPVETVEDFVALVACIEDAAARTRLPLRIEGYLPPPDPRIDRLFVTPDPGVIEVNVHPARDWPMLVENTRALYEEARLVRLSTEKFMLDGRHTGTGGGNHVTIGGPTPVDSPLLRRPDVLRSLVTYWQNHPALSYLFSGMFIGPTSQAPRVDEARDDSLYELEIAFGEMTRLAQAGETVPEPWLVDRLLRNILIDVTGNTHRAEFCIDKLYSPDGATGRLGLLEFRAFEMPPHWQMSALQMLLLRALVARFWKTPLEARLVDWGTSLHDRFMLPHYVARDMDDVLDDLNQAGYAFEPEWFAPFFEFRFPRYGTVNYQGVELELRQALEPWHVLGEESQTGGATRYVDSSVERLQVLVRHMHGNRFAVLCNGRQVPLTPTGTRGEFVAGVRYKAWQPPSALHPTISVHTPLVFDLYDTWSGRALGGCTYHVMHPGGRNYERFPVNANEAEARRVARFQAMGHTPGPMPFRPESPNGSFPLTLDLRRRPDFGVATSVRGQQTQQTQQ